jgi:fructokinase
MPEKIVVGLGEILWDLLPQGKQLGGAPANFACHAHFLGAEAHVASAVGNDELGREIREILAQSGLGLSALATDANHPTGTVSVTLDADGHPSYIIHENVAWDFLEFGKSEKKLAKTADAVCFGTLAQRGEKSARGVQEFLSCTRPECLRIFDINLRQKYYSREIVNQSLQSANIFKLNDEELPVVAELLDIKPTGETALAEILNRFSLRLIALTCGGAGSVLLTAEGISRHPGFPTKVADTVGAGDSFTATLAVGILAGHALEKIHERASRVAAFVCSQAGATPRPTHNLLEDL